MERAKIKLSEKKYFGLKKPIIFHQKHYKQAYFCIIMLKQESCLFCVIQYKQLFFFNI